MLKKLLSITGIWKVGILCILYCVDTKRKDIVGLYNWICIVIELLYSALLKFYCYTGIFCFIEFVYCYITVVFYFTKAVLFRMFFFILFYSIRIVIKLSYSVLLKPYYFRIILSCLLHSYCHKIVVFWVTEFVIMYFILLKRFPPPLLHYNTRSEDKVIAVVPLS